MCTLPGYPVPGTFNYRLPLNPRRWVRVLDELEPSLIEAGDAFHPAWCAWRVARRRGIALAAFYHSNLPQIIGRRVRRVAAQSRRMRRYVRWLYERFDVVFAPSRLMCAYLQDLGVAHAVHQPLGVDAQVFSPERRAPCRCASGSACRATRRGCCSTRGASPGRRTCRCCCRRSRAWAAPTICC